MEIVLSKDGIQREIVRLVKLCDRMHADIYEMNDDLANIRLSGSDWLAEQHQATIEIAKEQIKDTYNKIGFLMVEGYRRGLLVH